MDAGLDSLKFSFNAMDERDFAAVTGVRPREWQTVIDHIRQAKRIRDEGSYKCGIYASSIERKGEDVKKMEEAVDLIRVFLPLLSPAWTVWFWQFSGGLWSVIWLFWAVCFVRILVSPRPDGRPA